MRLRGQRTASLTLLPLVTTHPPEPHADPGLTSVPESLNNCHLNLLQGKCSHQLYRGGLCGEEGAHSEL